MVSLNYAFMLGRIVADLFCFCTADVLLDGLEKIFKS